MNDAAARFERYLRDSEADFDLWLADYAENKLNPTDFSAQLDYCQEHPLPGYWLLEQDDQVIFWNNNRIGQEELKDLPEKSGLVELSNGVFYSKYVVLNDTVSGRYLIPLRDRYSIENKYLRNDFSLHFDGIADIRMLSAERAGQQVTGTDGSVLFTIALNNGQRSLLLTSHEYDSGIAFLLAILFAILLFFIKIDEQQVRNRPYRGLIEFVFVLGIIRFLLFRFRDKTGLQAVELFDPQIFASHWLLPSLGDLVLHLGVILMVIAYLFRYRAVYDKVFVALQPKFRLVPIQLFSPYSRCSFLW